MKIEHNGEEWHGTFVTTLLAMLNDILKDGPFGAKVIWQVDDRRVDRHEGQILTIVDDSADNALLIMDQGRWCQVEDILSVEAL